MQHTQAFRELKRGCDLLGRPRELAVELLRFLQVVRWFQLAPYGMELSAVSQRQRS
jgi:hypothetical protein